MVFFYNNQSTRRTQPRPLAESPSHLPYADGPANRTISMQIIEEDGTFTNPTTKVVQVLDVAPTIALEGVDVVDEGSAYTLTLGPVVDPGVDAVDVKTKGAWIRFNTITPLSATLQPSRDDLEDVSSIQDPTSLSFHPPRHSRQGDNHGLRFPGSPPVLPHRTFSRTQNNSPSIYREFGALFCTKRRDKRRAWVGEVEYWQGVTDFEESTKNYFGRILLARGAGYDGGAAGRGWGRRARG